MSHSSGNRHSWGNKQGLPHGLPHPPPMAQRQGLAAAGEQVRVFSHTAFPKRACQQHGWERATMLPRPVFSPLKSLLSGNWGYFLPNKPIWFVLTS